jgi:hypothetical protein
MLRFSSMILTSHSGGVMPAITSRLNGFQTR